MFWHEYAKIPRHASQNPIAEGDFSWILTRNCEGTEQLRFLIISIAFGVGESNKVRQVRQIIPVGAVSGDKVRQARQIIPVGSVSGD